MHASKRSEHARMSTLVDGGRVASLDQLDRRAEPLELGGELREREDRCGLELGDLGQDRTELTSGRARVFARELGQGAAAVLQVPSDARTGDLDLARFDRLELT